MKNTKQLLAKWRSTYLTIRTEITEFQGDLSISKDLIEYNIMCVEAMKLSDCIIGLMEAIAADENGTKQCK